eukprot:5404386-Amphidinium_carterae.1
MAQKSIDLGNFFCEKRSCSASIFGWTLSCSEHMWVVRRGSNNKKAKMTTVTKQRLKTKLSNEC